MADRLDAYSLCCVFSSDNLGLNNMSVSMENTSFLHHERQTQVTFQANSQTAEIWSDEIEAAKSRVNRSGGSHETIQNTH